MNGRVVGEWDSSLKAQFRAILEPNTNAQRLSLLSKFLRSLSAAIGRNCYSLLRSLDREFRFDCTVRDFGLNPKRSGLWLHRELTQGAILRNPRTKYKCKLLAKSLQEAVTIADNRGQ